jgi:hypothetical protein
MEADESSPHAASLSSRLSRSARRFINHLKCRVLSIYARRLAEHHPIIIAHCFSSHFAVFFRTPSKEMEKNLQPFGRSRNPTFSFSRAKNSSKIKCGREKKRRK